MNIKKIYARSLIVLMCFMFPNFNSLSAVTLQELVDKESSLTARINDIESNKRSIAKRIDEVSRTISDNIKCKTLTNHQVIELEREYNNLFKTIEKLSEEWVWLLCQREDIIDEIDKMRADNK